MTFGVGTSEIVANGGKNFWLLFQTRELKSGVRKPTLWAAWYPPKWEIFKNILWRTSYFPPPPKKKKLRTGLHEQGRALGFPGADAQWAKAKPK